MRTLMMLVHGRQVKGNADPGWYFGGGHEEDKNYGYI